ncbi:MAG: glycosyltransferase, partial [Comamonas sp.]
MRVLHFVTGGFSGATQVAVDLCLAARRSQSMPVLLVLRRKRNTDAARVQALRDQGLDVRVVPGWSHAATIWALRRIARDCKPDILVAHGFSDHLWGRYAGLLAGVPKLVHVEHNSRE